MSQLLERLTRTLAGRYTGIELLGAGGMASVFRAHDIALDRTVAIKVLPPDLAPEDRLISRFEQEAKLAAKLDHPNIIPIYRVESENGLNYFVMKYVSGKSLDAILIPGRPLDVEFTMRVLLDAAAALGHAHQRGVVHRDVKPANIMIDIDERVILTDFGISKAMETASGITKTGIIVGTPHYMAPEQAMGGAVDGRADQYALACVGYQMLTGELPFPGDVAHAVLHRHIYEQAKPLAARRADAPPAMVAAITRAMLKEPAARYADMDEFAAALEGRARSSRSGARPRTIAPTVAVEAATAPTSSGTVEFERSLSRSRRWRMARWAGALVLVAAAGAALARWQSAPPVAPASAAAHDTAAPVTTAAAASDSTRGGTVAPPTAPPSAPPRAVPVVRPAPPKPAPPKPAPPPAEAAFASLTVDADPYGTVYVNGHPLGPTPVENYRLTVGATYEISVEREGYKTKKETIHVTRPDEVHRRYVLDPVQP